MQVEGLCKSMLNLPNRNAVYDYLLTKLPTFES